MRFLTQTFSNFFPPSYRKLHLHSFFSSSFYIWAWGILPILSQFPRLNFSFLFINKPSRNFITFYTNKVIPLCPYWSNMLTSSFCSFSLSMLFYFVASSAWPLKLDLYVLQSSVLPSPLLPNYRLSLKYIHHLGFNNHLLFEIYKLLSLSKFEHV